MRSEEERKAAHNAARVLQNMSGRGVSKASKEECTNAAHEIYRVFGEPEQPITSTGGNYFDLGTKP